jgi:hypothetical protein
VLGAVAERVREHVRAACLEIRRLHPSRDRDALEALAAGLAARPA